MSLESRTGGSGPRAHASRSRATPDRRGRQRLQRARRAMHHVADAVDVDDDEVLAVGVDDALELADHASVAARPCSSATALPVMRMRHRDRERVGGVLRLRIGLRQQHADHQADLRLLGVAGADDGLLHQVGRVFGDDHARLRRHQQRDAARLPELQGRGRVAVDEGRLDGRLVGAELIDDARQPVVDRDQPLGERELLVGLDRTAGHVDQPVALAADQAPAGAAEARIDAENANRLSHRAPLIAPRGRAFPAMRIGFRLGSRKILHRASRDRPSRPAGPHGRADRPPLRRSASRSRRCPASCAASRASARR